MSFFNEHFLPIIRKYVEEIRDDGKPDFSTVDLIKQYTGHYYSDKVYPNESINANIGKFLKENANALGIREIESDKPVVDDSGQSTSTSVWEFVMFK